MMCYKNMSVKTVKVLTFGTLEHFYQMLLTLLYCRTTPTSPLPFTFDNSLVEDTSGKLLAGQLTVDNLTIEWLRAKLTELESSVKEIQEKQTSQCSHVEVANNRTSHMDMLPR